MGLCDQRTWPRQRRCFLAAEARYRGSRGWRRVGPQAAADRVDPQLRQGTKAPRRALFYGIQSAARNDISLYAIARVPSAWAANIGLQNSSHPAEVSPLFFFF